MYMWTAGYNMTLYQSLSPSVPRSSAFMRCACAHPGVPRVRCSRETTPGQRRHRGSAGVKYSFTKEQRFWCLPTLWLVLPRVSVCYWESRPITLKWLYLGISVFLHCLPFDCLVNLIPDTESVDKLMGFSIKMRILYSASHFWHTHMHILSLGSQGLCIFHKNLLPDWNCLKELILGHFV